jgi:hypothetical protein
VVVVVGGNATRVRLAPKLPLWIRLVIVLSRLLVWTARKLVAYRSEVAAVVVVLLVRTLLVRQIGSVAGDLLLLGVAVVALAWPDTGAGWSRTPGADTRGVASWHAWRRRAQTPGRALCRAA